MDPNALARLKRLSGKSTLILTHYGRKSGKPYDVKIWFVVDGDKVSDEDIQDLMLSPRFRSQTQFWPCKDVHD